MPKPVCEERPVHSRPSRVPPAAHRSHKPRHTSAVDVSALAMPMAAIVAAAVAAVAAAVVAVAAVAVVAELASGAERRVSRASRLPVSRLV
eukprot:3087117-Pleurochrysis_carterae.AAC.1